MKLDSTKKVSPFYNLVHAFICNKVFFDEEKDMDIFIVNEISRTYFHVKQQNETKSILGYFL